MDHPRSVRLTFHYDEHGLRLAGRTPRRSPPPPTEPVNGEPPNGAIVLDLRSAAGEVRYRRLLSIRYLRRLRQAPARAAFDASRTRRRSGRSRRSLPRRRRVPLLVVSVGPAVRLAQPALHAVPDPRGGASSFARVRSVRDEHRRRHRHRYHEGG